MKRPWVHMSSPSRSPLPPPSPPAPSRSSLWILETIYLFTLFLQSLSRSVVVLVAQSYPTLCDPTDCGPPGSSVHGILQEGILEWTAIPFCRGSSLPRDQTWVSWIAGRFFTIWATGKILDHWSKWEIEQESWLTFRLQQRPLLLLLPVCH